MTTCIRIEFLVAYAFINGMNQKNETCFKFDKINAYSNKMQQYFNKEKLDAIIVGNACDITTDWNDWFKIIPESNLVLLNLNNSVKSLQTYFWIDNDKVREAFYLKENVEALF